MAHIWQSFVIALLLCIGDVSASTSTSVAFTDAIAKYILRGMGLSPSSSPFTDANTATTTLDEHSAAAHDNKLAGPFHNTTSPTSHTQDPTSSYSPTSSPVLSTTVVTDFYSQQNTTTVLTSGNWSVPATGSGMYFRSIDQGLVAEVAAVDNFSYVVIFAAASIASSRSE